MERFIPSIWNRRKKRKIASFHSSYAPDSRHSSAFLKISEGRKRVWGGKKWEGGKVKIPEADRQKLHLETLISKHSFCAFLYLSWFLSSVIEKWKLTTKCTNHTQGENALGRLLNPVLYLPTFYFPTFPLVSSQSPNDGIAMKLRIVVARIIESVMQPSALFPTQGTIDNECCRRGQIA